jgi:putative FmdB family regulatory protein
MPIYEYKRKDGTVFEIHQSMKEDALEFCPDSGQPCKRIISGGNATLLPGHMTADGSKTSAYFKPEQLKTTLTDYRQKILKDPNTKLV